MTRQIVWRNTVPGNEAARIRNHYIQQFIAAHIYTKKQTNKTPNKWIALLLSFVYLLYCMWAAVAADIVTISISFLS